MKYKKPGLGDIRVVERFLFFPKCLNDKWRWWRRARIRQQRQIVLKGALLSAKFIWQKAEWVDVGWED